MHTLDANSTWTSGGPQDIFFTSPESSLTPFRQTLAFFRPGLWSKQRWLDLQGEPWNLTSWAYRGSFTPNNVYNCNPESLQYLVCFQMILTFLQDMMNWNESSQSFVETFIVDGCPQANLNPQWRALRHHEWLVWMRWWDVLGCYCTWCKGRSKKLKENKKR